MAMKTGGRRIQAELNVTPMIDILLVLLIIFMVMTPLMMMQHRVEVPRRSEVDLPPEVSQDQVVLTLTKDGATYLNQVRVDRAELDRQLVERFKNRLEKTLFLNIDPLANYGEALRVIDLTRSAGLEKLAIVTLKEGESFQIPGAAAAQ